MPFIELVDGGVCVNVDRIISFYRNGPLCEERSTAVLTVEVDAVDQVDVYDVDEDLDAFIVRLGDVVYRAEAEWREA